MASTAWADPGAAPDPRRGERTDGKLKDARSYDVLLTVPRILLAPPRLVLRALGEPVRAVLAIDERYHLFRVLTHIFTSEDGKRGVRPEIRYISRFAPQLGLTYFDNKLLGPGSSLSVTVGAVLPALLYAEVSVRPRMLSPYGLRFGANYLKRDDVLFAGVGPASQGGLVGNSSPIARVAVETTDVTALLDVKLHRMIRLRIGQAWSLRRYGNGRSSDDERPIAETYCKASVTPTCLFPTVDRALVPGYHEGANFFATDASLSFDTRRGNYSPSYWLRLELGGRFAQSPSSAGPSWVRGRAAIAAGMPLGSNTRSLVLRIAAELLQPIGSSVVPFTELVTLGGPDDLRGVPIARFRDHASVVATLEYRWAVWMWADAVIFTDWGGVFGRRFDGFAIDRLVPDVGVGLQVHTDNHFVMRVQVAYGFSEGFQVMFATTTGL